MSTMLDGTLVSLYLVLIMVQNVRMGLVVVGVGVLQMLVMLISHRRNQRLMSEALVAQARAAAGRHRLFKSERAGQSAFDGVGLAARQPGEDAGVEAERLHEAAVDRAGPHHGAPDGADDSGDQGQGHRDLDRLLRPAMVKVAKG